MGLEGKQNLLLAQVWEGGLVWGHGQQGDGWGAWCWKLASFVHSGWKQKQKCIETFIPDEIENQFVHKWHWTVLYQPMATAGILQPGVIHWRRDRCGDGASGNIPNNVQSLLKCMIHPEHIISPLSLVRRLLHQTVLVSGWVEICQQLRVNELLRL